MRFNWLTTLKELAKKRDGYVPRNFETLREKAEGWPTCACGQLCTVLDREDDGMPVDNKLADLGRDFYDKVYARKWKGALNVFKRIESRSAKLIKLEINRLMKEVRYLKAGLA